MEGWRKERPVERKNKARLLWSMTGSMEESREIKAGDVTCSSACVSVQRASLRAFESSTKRFRIR